MSADGNIQYRSDTGQFLTQILGTISSLFPKLRTAAQHGYARILKSATVLVRDGDDDSDGKPAKATISERVAIPFVISQGANNPPVVSYTNVDTSITVRARSIAGSDKLNVGIEAVQTEVQAAASDKSPPSTLANRVETQIVVPNGESAALGGLSTERRSVAFDRNPASSDPKQGTADFNVFNLGRAYGFTDTKGQFIVFVTPTKLRTTTEGTDQLKRKFRLRK
jgi:pilus assembly protein CpaC